MDVMLNICLGIGLAAACGFRVFLPCLVVGLAQRLGFPMLDGMPTWMASWPALTTFGVATCVEVGAYYLPWLDNALDAITTPLALIAGTLMFAASTEELPGLWRWGLAIVAGGGSAGVSQAATVAVRGLSTALTGGLTNFVVATFEWVGAIVTTLLVLLFAPLGLGLLVFCGVMLFKALRKRRTASVVAASQAT